MKRIAVLLCALSWLAAAQVKDISGTWIAKMTSPMGEMEIVYRLSVDAQGNITGTQSLPFGDSPIEQGKVAGDTFEFTVALESFGNIQKREVNGKIVGDTLRLTPAMPAPPPDAPMGAGPGGPGPMRLGEVTARRGTPAVSQRVTVDYTALPHITLPDFKEIPATGVAKTPPMGWNSWNKFHSNIDDKTVREIVDAMVASGMKDAGYQYVNIDDGWQGARDANGVLQPNPNFPDMKALAGYVHSKGLKLGIYSSPGPQTCGGFAGSFGHEAQDAKTWAEWGVDYLKYDWCSASRVWKDADERAVYQLMGQALAATGRPIVYGLCQYGRAGVRDWGAKVGASLWRMTGDIQDNWRSMSGIGFEQVGEPGFAQTRGFGDADMLEVGNGGMSNDEYKTHMSLWAMLSAPLIAGNDLRNMTPEVAGVLMNREVIAVNQDTAENSWRVARNGPAEVWAKKLRDGAYVVALFNTGESEAKVGVAWADLKVNGTRRVRDLWKHSDLGPVGEGFNIDVPRHGVVMVRVGR